jgi:Uma2 family endonuclease
MRDERCAMNATVDPMLDPALLAPERVRPLKRREYEQLVDLGVFADERVELLRGALVEMSPQGTEHSGITAWFAQRFAKALDLRRYETRSDRVLKTEIYAAAGVPEYWIVNVRTRTVEVLRGPTKTGYQRSSIKRIGDRLRPLKLRGLSFAVARIPWPLEDAPARERARGAVSRARAGAASCRLARGSRPCRPFSP